MCLLNYAEKRFTVYTKKNNIVTMKNNKMFSYEYFRIETFKVRRIFSSLN